MTSAALTAPDTDTSTPFGLYLHVPFCATRCGYCDFNTYTAGELGTSASPQSWLDGVRRELDLAAATFQRKSGRVPSVDTVFVGGGTPSLLGADGLADLLGAARSSFEFSAGAEVTTESNPESTSPAFFDGIRAAGFTRVSLGMQSAAPHVLAILDRTHTPGRAVDAAREAAAAGFDHVNLDLIYGTPGERDEDLDASLDAVLDAGVDHVSAYALIVEDGTALARRVRRGEIPMPDDDVLAARYERIDARLAEAGLGWYEVSNWARDRDAECRHNIGYWDGGDWWGIGPGAHSYVDGTRFWNVKHPARYAETLSTGELPIADSEVLTAEEQHMERVMLTARLRTGVAASDLSADEVTRARSFVEEGLLDAQGETFVLTDRGRLLADGVVRDILE
ncbi:coproporphyrinogen III oxidase [Rhodococcus sp. Leaf7]|uniref:radical SAM family heme chaperone HemW n=1 Tax=unclassified Rhodococcus (in: high G+C Gram-positive bacteria) TaxID=192944 RepID=UPI0006FAC82D|nr:MULTISPECIES: radical SAM family heme chaperone HemW [unclassified Rhodococcus (in: high G+C Gram-positive bacteria)]KQU03206.1 coproporphyrinogen III oxidase [Rhodococcus sp. Leaf7]KQU38306.1 coproporphyrinogen III oxidase [Rhodococcus sp. Leaf247]